MLKSAVEVTEVSASDRLELPNSEFPSSSICTAIEKIMQLNKCVERDELIHWWLIRKSYEIVFSEIMSQASKIRGM